MAVEKIYAMPFAKIYPMLVAKAEKKGRTKSEVDEVICWLTGYLLIPIVGAALKNFNPVIHNAVNKAVAFIDPAAPVTLEISL